MTIPHDIAARVPHDVRIDRAEESAFSIFEVSAILEGEPVPIQHRYLAWIGERGLRAAVPFNLSDAPRPR